MSTLHLFPSGPAPRSILAKRFPSFQRACTATVGKVLVYALGGEGRAVSRVRNRPEPCASSGPLARARSSTTPATAGGKRAIIEQREPGGFKAYDPSQGPYFTDFDKAKAASRGQVLDRRPGSELPQFDAARPEHRR